MAHIRKLAAAAMVTALGVAIAPVPAQAATSGPARILIAGDSVTEGKVGDYTWRYRLWNNLQAARADVDFVGPLTGLADPGGATNVPGYADPNFDQDHAARWGAALVTGGWWVNDGLGTYVTTDLTATYRPDVVVDELGLNNLTWFGQTPQAVIDLQATFVADVRSANPSATVILGQLSQTWDAGVPSYNDLLTSLAASLDRPGARVIVAPAPSDYTAAADTYDGTHPTVQGEVKLAAQYSGVLLGLGLPTMPTPPTQAAAFTGAAHVAAVARIRAARLTFTTPAGATRQALWKRDATTGGRWRLVAYVTPGQHAYRATALHRHHRYTFRMRAYDGATPSTAYSNRVGVRVR